MPNLDCILIRHGEPDCAADIYLGRTNPPLSELGRAQCAQTAAWCARQWPDFKPQQIYCSALQRAIDSAAVVQEHFAVPIEQDQRINEIYFGEWEGLAFAEVEKKLPGALERWFSDPLHHPAPGGEDFYHLAERVDSFLHSDVQSPCIIVAHYCSIAVLASRLLGVPLSHADRLALHRGCCGRIQDGHLKMWGVPTRD